MADWTYHISLVVTDNQQRILLLPDGEQWMLPHFTQSKLFTHLYLLTRRIQAEMGAELVVLRPLVQHRDEAARVMDALLLMDTLTTGWQPSQGSRWVDRAALDGLILRDEWLRPALEKVLSSVNNVAPVEHTPWFMPGWFGEASQWMQDVLIAKGYTLLRPPEPFKQGSISAVLRSETDHGHVYFKVALKLPLFGHEPMLTAALGALYPDVIQSPLAIDETRRWMLTADFGTELRESQPSPQTMQTVLKTYTRLQIDTASHIDELFEVGCLDRRLDVLASQIDGLLADEESYQSLNADEKAEWQASGDRLKALCQRLAGYHLPYTLVHGDFHGGNIALQNERIRFFDWTDACVAHPFFDLTPLINPDDTEKASALQASYLEEWTAYEPLERLREACAIAFILGALHQVVSYSGIMNGVEADQRDDWAPSIPFFVRRILAQLKTLPT